MSNNVIKNFGKAIIDTTKGGKARVQFIEAGKAAGVFVQPIYVDALKAAGVELSDVLTAINHAWLMGEDDLAPKKKKKAKKVKAPKVRRKSGDVVEAAPKKKKNKKNKKRSKKLSKNPVLAAAMALELFEQGNRNDARDLAKGAGIVSAPQGRGWDGLADLWMQIASNEAEPTVGLK